MSELPTAATEAEIAAAAASTAPFIYEIDGERFAGTCILTDDDRVIGVTPPVPIGPGEVYLDREGNVLPTGELRLPWVLVAKMTPEAAAGMRRRLTAAGATGWEYPPR